MGLGRRASRMTRPRSSRRAERSSVVRRLKLGIRHMQTSASIALTKDIDQQPESWFPPQFRSHTPQEAAARSDHPNKSFQVKKVPGHRMQGERVLDDSCQRRSEECRVLVLVLEPHGMRDRLCYWPDESIASTWKPRRSAKVRSAVIMCSECR
ncbi:hypothetical protein BDV18DRAFT_146870 [Aspergillus unguis]